MQTRSAKITEDGVVNREDMQRIDVEFDLIEDGKVVDHRSLGFAYVDGAPMTESEIQDELEKYTKLYFKEKDDAVVEKEKEAQREEANEIANNISGKEIDV